MHHQRTACEPLESRSLFALDVPVDLLVDANRDGSITASLDNTNEDTWTSGKNGRGALILPNIDKDNTASGGAPDNWTGGVWNGKTVAPNNVIDNAADLLDVGRMRLRMLNTDASYNYRVTLQLFKPTSEASWFANTSATDRVRVFMPTKPTSTGDVVPQAGDIAVIGPGLGDTIRFVNDPSNVNEYPVSMLAGNGFFEFGVEGLKPGAGVRFKLTVEYIETFPGGPPPDPNAPIPTATDSVRMRVAPFVLSDNRQAADKVIVEDMRPYGFDNAEARDTIKNLFGSRAIDSKTGDFWQQDGYEIGYVRAPYGSMPVVLELPRARSYFFDFQNNMRSFVRGALLKSGVGVATDIANLPNDPLAGFGGDIESLPRPGTPAGTPGYLLTSGMPQKMKDFFAAQDTNPLLELKLDDWMGIAHVDEVVQASPDGKHVMIADPDLAWGLALWAVKLNPNARMLPGMNGNDAIPGYSPSEGAPISFMLNHAEFRRQNLEFAQSTSRLRGVSNTVKQSLGLTEELTAPAKNAANKGSAALSRGGAFVSMLGNTKRTFEVRFLDADRYELRYTDTGKSPSQWFAGRKSKDEVFPDAKAFILKNYWTGVAKAGDRFTFATNPSATLIKIPQLFFQPGVLQEPPNAPPPPFGIRLLPFSTNHINALVDRTTVVSGKAYGPKVNWNGTGNSDLFEAYTRSVYKEAGFTQITFADARAYHEASGSLHCGTNVIRAIPGAKWWEA